MKNRNWYLQKILLNFSNDGATYKAVKSIVVNNLTSKGVSCSMENGMTTLANKILDIQSGTVTHDYDVSLNLSSDDVVLGNDIILTATLNANIDNTTVDLDGEISGATVKFYLNNTLLGTSNTNSQGVATYNYTPSDVGDYTFHTVFDGADDFDDATSSDVTVSVTEEQTIETVTITCLGYGTDIPFYHPNYPYVVHFNGETKNTNTNGQATFTNVGSGTKVVRLWRGAGSYYMRTFDGNSSPTVEVDSEHTSITTYWITG